MQAKEKAIALAVGVGSGYSYETTFEKEVYSDLYGERGVLMGGIRAFLPSPSLQRRANLCAFAEGMFLAQYKVLRANGHSPSEAFNETVEEATQSLFPLIGAHGMDYMFAACSSTFPSLVFTLSLTGPLPSHSHRPPWCPRLGSPLRGRQQARLRGPVRCRP